MGQPARNLSTGPCLAAGGLQRRNVNDRIRELARTLWQYHQLGHELLPADAIFVLCSHDIAVAERGAQLWLDGWAPLLIYSGGLGSITKHLWTEPEANRFAEV